ncbi:MAG: ATP-binding protein [Pseudomonadota bacterium]
MRIQTRLLLILLVVALVPVTVSGVTAVMLSRRVLTRQIQQVQVTEARTLAENVDSYIGEALRELRLVADITPFATLSGEEQRGALGLVYRLHDGFNVAGLVDSAGEGVGPPVFTTDKASDPSTARHHPVNEAELVRFASNIPLQAALTAGAAVGPVYVSTEKGLPLLVLAVLVPGRVQDREIVLAVELALDPVLKRVQETASQVGATAYIVDSRGRVVAHSLPEVALARSDFSERKPVQAITGSALDSHGMVRYRAGDTRLASAFARLGRLPWGAVVERPEQEAFAPANQIAKQTIFWIAVALICAIAAGLVLSRSIGDPLHALTRVAESLGQGDLDVRARVSGRDELSQLASSFNQMADAIARRDEELHAFADDLQKRVEERTRELKLAQDQLLQSEKLAAVGELGAGVAHEINNPLAGVLGSAQLLLLRTEPDHPSREHLGNIESEALRIREIVQNLLQLAQSKEKAAGTLIDVNRVVEAALSLVARPIIAQRIRVHKDLTSGLPKIRASASDLQQLFMHLLSNAKNAMPDGGELRIASSAIENRLVKVTIADTGIGIRQEDLDKIFEPFFTRKEDWDGKGLGLSVVHRTVEQTGGRVTVESERGHGACFTLVFPMARDGLHLA